MLKDLLEKYYFDQNYNCAESLLHAANEYYDLGITDHDLILAAGFGAGMQSGNTCGAVLAAISVLSLKYVEAKAHESEDIKPRVKLFLEKFQQLLGSSILCRDIKPVCFQPECRCIKTVQAACDALEDTIRAQVNLK